MTGSPSFRAKKYLHGRRPHSRWGRLRGAFEPSTRRMHVLLAGLGPYERSGQFRGDRNRSRVRTDPEGRGGKGRCGIGVGRGHGGFSIGIHQCIWGVKSHHRLRRLVGGRSF
jgi:hypothetical protein